MPNKLTEMASELLAIESDFPLRVNRDKLHGKPITVDDFQLITFEQTWGSTALGFNGVGGQAMTSANTYVFIPEVDDEKCHVYFAGRFAYSVEYSDVFMEDVRKHRLEPVWKKGKYLAAAVCYDADKEKEE